MVIVLYIVGGVARTGKSIVAQRIMREFSIPYLSLDILMMGLYRGLPELGVNPEDPDFDNPEKMWPIVRNMSRNIIEANIEHLLEGVSILPKHVHELRKQYFPDIKGCFLGYAYVSPEDKLHGIRKYSGYPNDWSDGFSDKELLDFISIQIKHSKYLEAECSKYDIKYFDESTDFENTLNIVVNFLLTKD